MADPNQDFFQRCARKRRFETQEAAEQEAWRAMQAYNDGAMCTYRCTYCDGWHVGHVPASARADGRR